MLSCTTKFIFDALQPLFLFVCQSRDDDDDHDDDDDDDDDVDENDDE